MNFTNWLENKIAKKPNTKKINQDTTIVSPSAQLNPGETDDFTQTYSSQSGTPEQTSSIYQMIANALKPIDFASTESGYSGTPLYSSPEQLAQIGQVNHSNHEDFYQSMLVKELPKLFPQLANQTMQMYKNWMAFKNEVLKRMNENSNIDSMQQLQPVQFQLPLTTLQQADTSFQKVHQILSRDKNPQLNNLRMLFQTVYQNHLNLKKQVEQPLMQRLKTAQTAPYAYKSQ